MMLTHLLLSASPVVADYRLFTVLWLTVREDLASLSCVHQPCLEEGGVLLWHLWKCVSVVVGCVMSVACRRV